MERHLYLALGDSVTAGYGATRPEVAFVNQISRYAISSSLTKRTQIVAENGWTTRDVLQAASIIQKPVWDSTRLLTLMTGGNDLRSLLRRLYFPIFGSPITPQLVNQRLEEFKFHMKRLCDAIHKHKIPHVLVATVYNPAPNFPLAVHAMDSLNAAIRDYVKQHHFLLVDVHKDFQEKEKHYIEGYRSGRFEDLASPIRRPIHPNNAGHQRIAQLITECLDKRKRLESR